MNIIIQRLINYFSQRSSTIINYSLIITSLLILFAFIIFVVKFNNQIFSSEMEDWGNFGDFMSGSAGIFIGFLSLIVIYKFSEIGKDFNNRSLEVQIKSSIYKSFIEKLDSISNSLNFEVSHENDVKKIKYLLDSFKFYLMNFHYEVEIIIKDNKKDVVESIELFLNEIQYLCDSYEQKTNPSKIDWENFYKNRAKLIYSLHSNLLN